MPKKKGAGNRPLEVRKTVRDEPERDCISFREAGGQSGRNQSNPGVEDESDGAVWRSKDQIAAES